MDDFKKNLTVTITGRTCMSMQAFLKKHGYDEASDVSRFIEDALTWRILDRQLAYRRKNAIDAFNIFNNTQTEDQDQMAQGDQQLRTGST
jgi:hypothetical protein